MEGRNFFIDFGTQLLFEIPANFVLELVFNMFYRGEHGSFYLALNYACAAFLFCAFSLASGGLRYTASARLLLLNFRKQLPFPRRLFTFRNFRFFTLSSLVL